MSDHTGTYADLAELMRADPNGVAARVARELMDRDCREHITLEGHTSTTTFGDSKLPAVVKRNYGWGARNEGRHSDFSWNRGGK